MTFPGTKSSLSDTKPLAKSLIYKTLSKTDHLNSNFSTSPPHPLVSLLPFVSSLPNFLQSTISQTLCLQDVDPPCCLPPLSFCLLPHSPLASLHRTPATHTCQSNTWTHSPHSEVLDHCAAVRSENVLSLYIQVNSLLSIFCLFLLLLFSFGTGNLIQDPMLARQRCAAELHPGSTTPFYFETEFYQVAQAGLELVTSCLSLSKCWDDRNMPSIQFRSLEF